MHRHDHRFRWVRASGLILVFVFVVASGITNAQPGSGVVPVTDEMLQDPAPEDWLMWRRTLDSWGYSPLDQVKRENVDQLQMVWAEKLQTQKHGITEQEEVMQTIQRSF